MSRFQLGWRSQVRRPEYVISRTRSTVAAILGIVVVLIIAAAVVASGVTPERPSADPLRIPVPDVTRRTSQTSDPKASDHGCAALVGALTADAVREAQALAGERTVCFPAGRIEGQFRADVAGQTWRLDPATILAGTIHITAPGAWITGGTVELPGDDPWREGVIVGADNVTIASVRFQGGGVVVSVKGRDGTQILDSTFNGQSGTAIFIWGEGRGADDTLISGNTIDQSATNNASPISSRAADDPSAGVLNRRITVSGNTIDQGDEQTGWFGVELKLSPEAIIVDNDIRGGATLISLPDSDDSIVSGNRLDTRGSPYWAVEIASSDGVTVEDNRFIGDGPDSVDVAVSMNSGSMDALISANDVRSMRTLVDLTGDDHIIADNCLAQVSEIVAYRSSAGSNVEIARNGPCSS